MSAVLGVVIALVFEGFETLSHEIRDAIWVDWLGPQPSGLATILLATGGGIAVGLAILAVPGHGGAHPADTHEFAMDGAGEFGDVIGVLAVGFVALVAGASLGPEGALLPAVATLAALSARWARMTEPWSSVMPGVGMAAVLAAMFGSPLAGAVPLLEVFPATGAAMTMLLLPALVASATSVLTLQVLGAEPAGSLQLGYSGFEQGDLVWAILVGALAGLTVTGLAAVTSTLRLVTRLTDRRNVVLTTSVGGLLLGLVYVIGGDEVRFAGIPELQGLIASADTATAGLVATLAKVAATGLCLAIGYRGGQIFPLAFAGGAVGLTLHLAWDAVPADVAIGAGLAGAIAVGVQSPVTAALIAAVVVGPEMLPLAIVAVVAAHVVHVLADQLSPTDPAVESVVES